MEAASSFGSKPARLSASSRTRQGDRAVGFSAECPASAISQGAFCLAAFFSALPPLNVSAALLFLTGFFIAVSSPGLLTAVLSLVVIGNVDVIDFLPVAVHDRNLPRSGRVRDIARDLLRDDLRFGHGILVALAVETGRIDEAMPVSDVEVIPGHSFPSAEMNKSSNVA